MADSIPQHRWAVLRAARLIPVLRYQDAETALYAAQVALRAGCRGIELTWTIPGVLDVLRSLRAQAERAGQTDVLIGVGTVLDAGQARSALEAGADFLVAPGVVPALVELAGAAGALSMLGAFTPTEIIAAKAAGADVVKIFPADTGGPGHLAAVKAVFPDTSFCPTGGVTRDNMAAYFRAGADIVGMGSNLFDKARLAARDTEALVAALRATLQDAGAA
ncbi:bifunctional 4-hydroxy-2-oxoglutarate aldolase/2-dehydro-3-deoxy-phosphogluconate aldolase [Pigmentiphaga sp.]|uniref:bifunctional 4-hydroxy-2-oxoglutarate aldolase/2-dehydro-3-deoxy-phosphogluconate aldolase n=1 Tax=Pigmentiphaga sp. TaxID=1977564 RepID=UPI00128CD4B5|nr:bifunctional 4-hydroxy-2-oxoglutarate aldolase/2-dehydro-3-deoxy-phosphogluconate aldolase [Pigmentiphaga sp.]MPS25729.1 bifunctional 4-hydroxy-2-oxoglutarate aldolase/2-dehydro-3-deoxy-phosphogluconate aldolase [Alcaligenaceae bacterium SAGV5]MPS54453.1 bifunctional 4-hydroxy-2-oxoglutarate aldolase/2-dehydro-3-deoxy-phosphogluconate aldolase [Alcaligenaceae bacterium SAGV3]MPT58593.1 bifunctional 4-hydroxy-2-oxoglutarate aldolase/2-dehydro-3-deoxy-phosphogluconate aldolase [Alcaligenaceae b